MNDKGILSVYISRSSPDGYDILVPKKFQTDKDKNFYLLTDGPIEEIEGSPTLKAGDLCSSDSAGGPALFSRFKSKKKTNAASKFSFIVYGKKSDVEPLRLTFSEFAC